MLFSPAFCSIAAATGITNCVSSATKSVQLFIRTEKIHIYSAKSLTINYMNKDKGPDTIVVRLIPTLSNKLWTVKLATISHGTGEQISIEGSNPSIINLIQALSLQVIT